MMVLIGHRWQRGAWWSTNVWSYFHVRVRGVSERWNQNRVLKEHVPVHEEPLLGVIRVCYNIALNSKSPVNQVTSKAMLTQIISIVFRRMETDLAVQVSTTSGSVTHKEAALENSSNSKGEEAILDDENDKEITLGGALIKQVKETSLASVEELQNLAGGADIKGLQAVLDKAVHLEDGEKIMRYFKLLYLQGLLEGVSDSFTKNFHFIDSVKAYLSYALLRASVSQSPIIFQVLVACFGFRFFSTYGVRRIF
ncbi:hypothetical protein U1Q18_007842 [Sarracenia purpurea var. burkii]